MVYINSDALIDAPKFVYSICWLDSVVRLVTAKRNTDSSSETIFRSC